jgi:hypothetical protein
MRRGGGDAGIPMRRTGCLLRRLDQDNVPEIFSKPVFAELVEALLSFCGRVRQHEVKDSPSTSSG